MVAASASDAVGLGVAPVSPPRARFVLQSDAPYESSAKWDIQATYYQARGRDAWLAGDVPYYITSNSAAARQHASVFAAAVARLEAEGALEPTAPLPVLELASGVGLFALNFLEALDDYDAEHGTALASRLRYFFTDYAPRNLVDAASNPHVRAHVDAGRLELWVADALAPGAMRPLDAALPAARPAFIAAFASYLHCCLPVSVVRKRGALLEERRVTLALRIAPPEAEALSPAELLQHPGTRRANLLEEPRYAPIPPGFFEDAAHERAFRASVAPLDAATALYPRGSLQSLRATTELLCPGGLLLVSDKGNIDCDCGADDRSVAPSLHGNSLAHPVNFPVLEAYARELGLAARRTARKGAPIHTLLVERRPEPSPTVVAAFDAHFVRHNANLDASDFYAAATRLRETRDYRGALRFYERVLAAQRSDARTLYFMGCCHLELEEFDEALDCLARAAQRDYFDELATERRRAECLERLAQRHGGSPA